MPNVIEPPLAFVKIYGQLLMSSSLMDQPDHVFRLFICMLAIADSRGVVTAGGVPALARQVNLTVDKCREALGILEAPDPDSQTPDNEGRRVIRQQGGWLVVNAVKYRETRTRAQLLNAARQRRHRRKEKEIFRGATGDELPPDEAYEGDEPC